MIGERVFYSAILAISFIYLPIVYFLLLVLTVLIRQIIRRQYRGTNLVTKLKLHCFRGRGSTTAVAVKKLRKQSNLLLSPWQCCGTTMVLPADDLADWCLLAIYNSTYICDHISMSHICRTLMMILISDGVVYDIQPDQLLFSKYQVSLECQNFSLSDGIFLES